MGSGGGSWKDKALGLISDRHRDGCLPHHQPQRLPAGAHCILRAKAAVPRRCSSVSGGGAYARKGVPGDIFYLIRNSVHPFS